MDINIENSYMTNTLYITGAGVSSEKEAALTHFEEWIYE